MKKLLILAPILLLLVTACASEQSSAEVTVFRAPTWGCCGDWIAYMEDNGYDVKAEDVQDLSTVKNEYQVPVELQSCHTAIVDGYVIEGHVPAAEVERLLDERPDIIGLAVPGMPIGSPGMEVEGAEDQPYDVIAFDAAGDWHIFASYGQ